MDSTYGVHAERFFLRAQGLVVANVSPIAHQRSLDGCQLVLAWWRSEICVFSLRLVVVSCRFECSAIELWIDYCLVSVVVISVVVKMLLFPVDIQYYTYNRN